MAICIVSVGETHSGKTDFAIKFMLSALQSGRIRQVIANDVQREYKYRINQKITKYHGDFEGFIKVLQKYNYLGSKRGIIMDEAGDYNPHGQGISEVKQVLRGKRFNGNIYILNFHELMEVPTYIIRFADYFSISRSAGNPKELQKKYGAYPHIYNTWVKCMNTPIDSKGHKLRLLVKK